MFIYASMHTRKHARSNRDALGVLKRSHSIPAWTSVPASTPLIFTVFSYVNESKRKKQPTALTYVTQLYVATLRGSILTLSKPTRIPSSNNIEIRFWRRGGDREQRFARNISDSVLLDMITSNKGDMIPFEPSGDNIMSSRRYPTMTALSLWWQR